MTKSQEKKLDKLFSEKVRARNFCQWCGGKSDTLQTAHIFSRTYRHTRWCLLNGLCLCNRCHRKAHSRPTEFTVIVLRNLGQQAYNELRLKAYRLSVGNDRVEYEEVLKELEE